jgi:hypothetical protein
MQRIFCTEHGEFIDRISFSHAEKKEIAQYGLGGADNHGRFVDDDGYFRQHQLMHKFEASNTREYFTATTHLHSSANSEPGNTDRGQRLASESNIPAVLSSQKVKNPPRYYPCDHEGPCDGECHCFQKGSSCTPLCCCGKLGRCTELIRGCDCAQKEQPCTERSCNCVANGLECHPDICGTCGARELLDLVNINADKDVNKCGNCCIQLNRPAPTSIGESGVHGVGVYALRDIKKDDFICEYKGEVIHGEEGDRRGNFIHATAIGVSYILNVESRKSDCAYLVFIVFWRRWTLCSLTNIVNIDIDGLHFGNKSRFINHDANDANCEWAFRVVNYTRKCRIHAKKDIKAGEELFLDYGKDYFAHGGAGVITLSNPSKAKDESVQHKNIADKTAVKQGSGKGEQEPRANNRGHGTRKPGNIVRGRLKSEARPDPSSEMEETEPKKPPRKRKREQNEDQEDQERSSPPQQPKRRQIGKQSTGARAPKMR